MIPKDRRGRLFFKIEINKWYRVLGFGYWYIDPKTQPLIP